MTKADGKTPMCGATELTIHHTAYEWDLAGYGLFERTAIANLRAQLTAARTELAVAKVDAERYRHIRKTAIAHWSTYRGKVQVSKYVSLGMEVDERFSDKDDIGNAGDRLDAAIDAARKAQHD